MNLKYQQALLTIIIGNKINEYITDGPKSKTLIRNNIKNNKTNSTSIKISKSFKNFNRENLIVEEQDYNI